MKFFVNQGSELGMAGARIDKTIKRYAPSNIEFVSSYEEADAILIHHQFKHDLDYFLEKYKKPFIFMISEIYTDKEYLNCFFANEYLKLIWTFHPLDDLGYDTKGKFLHKPMGVDTDIFNLDYNIISKTPKINEIISFNCYDSESHEAIYNACKMTNSKMIHLSFHYQDFLRKGKLFDNHNHWYPNRFVSDEELIRHYLSCRYVSTLRANSGFEVPALEGILTGVRPIIFDNIYYTKWFKDFSITIPEESNIDLTYSLVDVFNSKYLPVKKEEVEYVRNTFGWNVIFKDFWGEVLQRV